MPVTIWGFFLLVFLFVYSCIALVCIGKLVNVQQTKFFSIVLLGLANAGLVFVLFCLDVGSTGAAYVGVFLLFLLEIWLLFRVGFRQNLFISVTFVLHAMVFHNIACMVLAWVKGQTIFHIANNYEDIFVSLLLTMLALSVATLLFMRFVSLQKVQIVMQNANQRMYLTIWMSICALYLLYNTHIFSRDIILEYLYGDQIIRCVTILVGVYIMLFYNFKVNVLLGYKEKSKDLSTKLNNNLEFLDAVTGRAIHKYEINVTRSLFRQGLSDEDGVGDKGWVGFSENLPGVAQALLVEEDIARFLAFISQDRLLELSERGQQESVLDYRVKGENGSARWCRMHISMIQEVETGDVLAFAYTLDVQDVYDEKQRIYEKTQLDLMTGVYNRNTFETLTGEALRRGGGILLMIDVDNFKSVNDLLGHDRGDEVLKHVARQLKAGFREDDIVGRFGGDEFMVFVKRTSDVNQILPCIEQIQKDTEVLLEGPEGKKLATSISIGITEIPMANVPFSVVYKQVDTALYRSKNRGKNRCSIYSANEWAASS